MPRNIIQTPTFTITEIISDSEDELSEESENEEERIKRIMEEAANKKKRKHNFDESEKKKTKLPSLNIMDNFDEEVKPGDVKVAKPFDYEQLKKQEQTKGVIYLMADYGKNQMPPVFKDERNVKRMLSEFGTVTRIEGKFERRAMKNVKVGYYAEFDDKNIAKRVALTLNGSPISRSDSRFYSVKFMPNFDWSEVGEDEELKKMKKKLLRAEAQKELKAIKEFKKNKKWSESIKKNKAPKPASNFRFNQKGFIRYEHSDTSHIDTLNIFSKNDDATATTKKEDGKSNKKK